MVQRRGGWGVLFKDSLNSQRFFFYYDQMTERLKFCHVTSQEASGVWCLGFQEAESGERKKQTACLR